MGFTSVTAFNFRNLSIEKLRLEDKTILFIGENGQGKTNILELLYFLCFGSSFRTRRDAEVISYGRREMSVQGYFTGADGYTWDIRVVIKSGKKTIFLNDKRIQDRVELISLAPCIVFSHDDIWFVKGTPERQRTFFNQTISICDPMFIDTLRTYRRVIKMRNLAIFQGREDMIDIYDAQLIPSGVEIMNRRKDSIDEFNQILTPMYREISGIDEDVFIRYRPSWQLNISDNEMRTFLLNKRDHDRERGITTTGPHRDRFKVYMGGKDFRSTASTGQMRLLSLVYRVVQARQYVKRTGKKPILLLDDVLLELDTTKRERFLQYIPEYEQAFFTFLPNEEHSRYKFENETVYNVIGGSIDRL